MATTEQKNRYFSVGQELSIEELSKYSWEDMQHRSLNDPRYAGCNSAFNWRDHLNLRFNDKQLEQRVIQTLDQFATTPEGQHTIRQAHAMHLYRIKTGQSQDRYEGPNQIPKLYITDQTTSTTTAFIKSLGAIAIQTKQLQEISAPSSDGKYYRDSLASALYHELCHAKDPIASANGERYINEIKGLELDAAVAAIKATLKPGENVRKDSRYQAVVEKWKSILEYPAITETNVFMQKYYGEKARELRHNDSRTNYWFDKWTGWTNPQPHLPDGIFYERMPLPPSINCKAVTKSLGR